MNRYNAALQRAVGPEEFRNILQLGGSDLTNAADLVLTGVCVRDTENLPVVNILVVEVQHADGAGLDQATSCLLYTSDAADE